MTVLANSVRHESGSSMQYVRLYQGDAGLDITDIINMTIIEEDIENGFIQATIFFVDDFLGSRDVLNGTETVEISFTSVDENYIEYEKPYVKKFRVRKYEQVSQSETGAVRPTVMYLIHEGAVKNDSIKLCRSYTNTSSSAFVNQCCDLLGVDENRFIEETMHAKHFVAPNVSPLDMINWMKLTSQSKDNNGSDFYFFENKDGVHFRSLETMKVTEPKHTLIFKGNVDNYTYNNILDYKKSKGYDLQDDIRFGGSGATLFTHDLYTKQYLKYTFDRTQLTRLNPVDPRGDAYEQNNNAYVQFWPHNNAYETLDKNSNGHNSLIRSMAKTSINFKTMNLQIPGNIDIKSGDVVIVRIPNPDGFESVGDSGKWLIKKIQHIITGTTYLMNLEVVTDGNLEVAK